MKFWSWKNIGKVLLQSILLNILCMVIVSGILYWALKADLPKMPQKDIYALEVMMAIMSIFGFLIFFSAMTKWYSDKIKHDALKDKIIEEETRRRKADEEFQAKYYFKLQVMERSTGNAVETSYPVRVWTSDK